MRDLSRTTLHTLHVDDRASGTQFDLQYRRPSTTEIIAYNRAVYGLDQVAEDRKGLAVNYPAMLDAVLPLIVGWTPGAFGIDGQVFSADPAAPEYRADWAELLREGAADILLAMAGQVFAGAQVQRPVAVPFGKS